MRNRASPNATRSTSGRRRGPTMRGSNNATKEASRHSFLVRMVDMEENVKHSTND